MNNLLKNNLLRNKEGQANIIIGKDSVKCTFHYRETKEIKEKRLAIEKNQNKINKF
jgi:hypothetical protein